VTLRFEIDDLTRPAVHRLLEQHLADMYATSPPESVHALDLDALRAPGITFWSVWEGEELLGCGALKTGLGDASDGVGGGVGDDASVELKSMRTAETARSRGVATALLTHLLAEARSAGARRVVLETGAEPYFEPARRLYQRHGFVERPPFGDYLPDPNSVFFERLL